MTDLSSEPLDIAVIGMSGRFPGAPDVEQFWSQLLAGTCALTRFSDPDTIPGIQSRRVQAGYVIADSDRFDAAFFGISPREAEVMDPQQRVLLECGWTLFEDAGYDPRTIDGLVGVFVGGGFPYHLARRVIPAFGTTMEDKSILVGNRPDFLATRLSYALGLQGPSLTVQSACSTSLVAVAQACAALSSYQADVAVAGGVAIDPGRGDGYLYTPEGILSPDGLIRTFDAGANGAAPGDGVGLVLLKRLDEAIEDGDHVEAVIKGIAVNNDGADRPGFTAPSAQGQANVIAQALQDAAVPPETVRFIEAHGSATALGDPVEVSALNAVYGTADGGRLLGAVKSNIGHLDAAAGAAGLIKAIVAIREGHVPPTLHFEAPNPRIDFSAGSFEVNTDVRAWPGEARAPRRAGVSSFGLGGTNAHAILEQAPPTPLPPARTETSHLIVFSAKTASALIQVRERLRIHLQTHPAIRIEDLSYTLRTGRRHHAHRTALVASSVAEVVDALTDPQDPRCMTSVVDPASPLDVAFVYDGFGAQRPGMGAALYSRHESFRHAFDRCNDISLSLDGPDLRAAMFRSANVSDSSSGDDADARADLDDPRTGYPVIFALEYALTELWRSVGITPSALGGHSLGEHVAACIAGVLSLREAMTATIVRSRLLDSAAPGAMLVAPLDAASARRHLQGEVVISAINSPSTTVFSGPPDQIDSLAACLLDAGVPSRALATRYGFHSPLVSAVVKPYRDHLRRDATLGAPKIPITSNTSGTWLTDEEARSADYWSAHLREPVDFSANVATIAGQHSVLIEIGPGQTLTTYVYQGGRGALLPVPTLGMGAAGQNDQLAWLIACGKLWLAGAAAPFAVGDSLGRRISLPGYPFEGERFEIVPNDPSPSRPSMSATGHAPSQWLWSPTWRRVEPRRAQDPTPGETWLLLGSGPRCEELARRLRDRGVRAIRVVAGERWETSADRYVVRFGDADHIAQLWRDLTLSGSLPTHLLFGWDPQEGGPDDATPDGWSLPRVHSALRDWVRSAPPALATSEQTWYLLTSGADVLGTETADRTNGGEAVSALARVISQEYPSIRTRTIDIDLVDTSVDVLFSELIAEPALAHVAVRGRTIWTRTYGALEASEKVDLPFDDDAAYLITGGYGRIGLRVAEWISAHATTTIVLMGRTGVAPRPPQDAEDVPANEREVSDAIRRIEARGSRVVLTRGDTADLESVQRVRSEVEARATRVAGVFHCAGITGTRAHIDLSETTDAIVAEHLSSKVGGALVLDTVFTDADFLVSFSSVAAHLGGLGFSAYASANAAMDQFTLARRREGRPWTSIDWEAWDFGDAATIARGAAAEVTEHALSADQGIAVLEEIFRTALPSQVVVSTEDFVTRQRRWEDPLSEDTRHEGFHVRPALRVPYAEPETETEVEVAEIWGDVLRIQDVGLHDNFFELGGSSLLGLQVLHRLRVRYQLAVPLSIVYEGPTVKTLSSLIDSMSERKGE